MHLSVWIELEIDREQLECFTEAGKSIEELIVWVYNEFILTANKELSLPAPGPSKENVSKRPAAAPCVNSAALVSGIPCFKTVESWDSDSISVKCRVIIYCLTSQATPIVISQNKPALFLFFTAFSNQLPLKNKGTAKNYLSDPMLGTLSPGWDPVLYYLNCSI